jgi:hypothetical protein
MRLALALATLAALHAHASVAQEHGYARTPGDTLRYTEVAHATTRMGDGGPVATYRESSRIALVFGPGDTARAWFEALRVQDSLPSGRRAAGPEGVGLPFVLAFGPRGVDSTLSAPDFPARLDSLMPLATQFANYFPRLSGQPLRPGAAWTDTVSLSESTDGWRATHVRVTEYRVVQDTTLRGVPVVVVEFTSRLDSRGADPAAGYEETRRLEDMGWFYFAPGPGVLVRRTRFGGGVTVGRMAASGQRFETTSEYSSTVELVPRD